MYSINEVIHLVQGSAMKKRIFFAGLLVAVFITTSWTFFGKEKPVLRLFTWAHYIDHALIEQFEKEQGCRLVIDTYQSNEMMFAKLNLAPSSYDIVTPSNYFVSLLKKRDLIVQLDKSKIENLRFLDHSLLPGMPQELLDSGMPYMLTYTGIGWQQDALSKDALSWDVFSNAELQKRMTLLDDPREAFGAALRYLGYSVNTKKREEVYKAKEVLISWKKNIAKFESEQYKMGLASGEYLVCQSYSGDIQQVREENPSIHFGIPKEGSTFSVDFFVLVKESPRKELAYRFLNFLFSPENAIKNMRYVRYPIANREAYVKDFALKQEITSFLDQQTLAKVELIEDVEDFTEVYLQAWDEVKAANT